jgi:hypothetical protein
MVCNDSDIIIEFDELAQMSIEGDFFIEYKSYKKKPKQ